MTLPVTDDVSYNNTDEQYRPVTVENGPDSHQPEGCINCQPTSVPEPTMAALLGLLLLGLLAALPRKDCQRRPGAPKDPGACVTPPGRDFHAWICV